MITTHALGWALVDSLWQNALAAAGLAALLAIIPVRAARTRYAVAIVTLALMLALPAATAVRLSEIDRKSTRLNSSHLVISYAVFCLKKKNKTICTPVNCV